MATRKYEQRARAASAEETRERILEATYERLREAPDDPVSLDHVARRAGVARSTIYLVFGSRRGLFHALAAWLRDRAGFARLVEAVQHPSAREHLRGAIAAGSDIYAAERDVAKALYSMAPLDPEAVAGITHQLDDPREGGLRYLAERLRDQGDLRPDVTVDEAVDILWALTSFDTFDQLYSGRGLSAAEVTDRLLAMAERTLCAP